MVSQHQQRFYQGPGLLAGGHQQRGFRGDLIGDFHRFTRQNQEAGDVLRLVRLTMFQDLQTVQRSACFAAQGGNGRRFSLSDFFHR